MRLAAGVCAAAAVFAALVLHGTFRITRAGPAPPAIALRLHTAERARAERVRGGRAREAVRRKVGTSRLAAYRTQRAETERP